MVAFVSMLNGGRRKRERNIYITPVLFQCVSRAGVQKITSANTPLPCFFPPSPYSQWASMCSCFLWLINARNTTMGPKTHLSNVRWTKAHHWGMAQLDWEMVLLQNVICKHTVDSSEQEKLSKGKKLITQPIIISPLWSTQGTAISPGTPWRAT